MATLKILALELSKAFVLYRQPMPEREEFELLVRAWADVLADVSDAEFIEGIRRVEAKLSFFPVPADVMRQVEEARKRTPAVNREALPENALTLDERCELGTDWCHEPDRGPLCRVSGRDEAHGRGRRVGV